LVRAQIEQGLLKVAQRETKAPEVVLADAGLELQRVAKARESAEKKSRGYASQTIERT